MSITLTDDTVFIADAHYSNYKPDIIAILDNLIANQTIKQIVLMGDIFETLSPYIKASLSYNQTVIAKIITLCATKEVIYIEGNHDFGLCNLFPKAKVFSLAMQPVVCNYNSHTIYLAHGDIFTTYRYAIFTQLLRHHITLMLLNCIDYLIKHQLFYKTINCKSDKHSFSTNFEQLAINRINSYLRKTDITTTHIIIEGHYHQGGDYQYQGIHYINLPAFFDYPHYLLLKDVITNHLPTQC